MCDDCSVCFMDAIAMNHSDVVQFLCRHGVFKSAIVCEKCGSEVRLSENGLYFACQKMVSQRKQKRTRCGLQKSARLGSFFSRIRLDLIIYWRLLAVLLHFKPPRQAFIRDNLSVSTHCVVDWYSFCREVFIDDMERHSGKIGGHKKWVEIDEAKFGRSKYNRGRYLKGQWVFGGVERGSNRAFYVPVEKRDAATLLAVLKDYVEPNTIIVSDCWKAYTNLDCEGYYHFTVNHSQNFVDPDTFQHTNTVERSWRELRATIPKYGVKKAHFKGYLAEFVFKKRYPPRERLHAFYQAAARLYPPTH